MKEPAHIYTVMNFHTGDKEVHYLYPYLMTAGKGFWMRKTARWGDSEAEVTRKIWGWTQRWLFWKKFIACRVKHRGDDKLVKTRRDGYWLIKTWRCNKCWTLRDEWVRFPPI